MRENTASSSVSSVLAVSAMADTAAAPACVGEVPAKRVLSLLGRCLACSAEVHGRYAFYLQYATLDSGVRFALPREHTTHRPTDSPGVDFGTSHGHRYRTSVSSMHCGHLGFTSELTMR